MIKSKAKLPDKLSELILVALEDLEKVKADPKFNLDMGIWYEPSGRNTCSVCFAGAVIAGRLTPNRRRQAEPYDFQEGDSRKLHALNSVRKGWLSTALETLDVDVPADFESRPYVRAVYDSELQDDHYYTQFLTQMRATSKWLAERGL